MDLYCILEVADVVIHINCAVRSSKQDGSAVRRPFDDFQIYLKLLSPKTGSFNTANNDSAIFVDDTYLFSVWRPLHVRDYTLVSVIDHFLKPMLLVHHPNDDKTLLVRSSQLLVLIVPLDDLDLAGVTLEWLVHCKITASLTFA